MKYKFLVFYKMNDSKFRVLYDDTNQFKTLYKLPETSLYHRFEVFKGYEASDEGLTLYKKDFNLWCDEIRTNDIMNIDYQKYYSHFFAVELTFKRLAKDKYEHHQKIDQLESTYIDRSNNGGLIFCNPGQYDSYGYDFSSFYPTIMGSNKFILPYKSGAEHFLTELPEILQLGYYHVKISSSHENINKIFAFSTDNIYINVSLQFALDNQKEFNINIELVIDDKPNCYLYDKHTNGCKIFGSWYDRLFKLKTLCPTNKLIKHLLSSLWGSLSRGNFIYRNYDQIINENLDVSKNGDSDYKIISYDYNDEMEIYKLQNTKDPYKHNIRLKSFLTAYGRIKIAQIALEDLDNVIRIHTDGIAFQCKKAFKIPLLLVEQKTTGLIEYFNVNNYSNLNS
jgi:hypothetical protein